MPLKKICFAILLLASVTGFSQSSVPVWTKNVGAKTFPSSQKIFYVNDYGAVSDTITVNTKAIQKAIDECSASILYCAWRSVIADNNKQVSVHH